MADLSKEDSDSWVDSEHYRRYARRRVIALACMAIAVIYGASYIGFVTRLGRSPLELYNLDIFLVVVLLVMGSALIAVWRSRFRSEYDSQYRQVRTAQLQEEEGKLVTGQDLAEEIDYASLWVANQRRIDYYHDLALKQSSQSFRSGQIATFVGFGLIIVLAIIAGLAESTPGAIAAGSIGLAGTVLTGYISSTFMKSQSEASAQINQFFAQPVELSRVLGAERLVIRLMAPYIGLKRCSKLSSPSPGYDFANEFAIGLDIILEALHRSIPDRGTEL